MVTVGAWLVGLAAYPTEGLIWSNGGGLASLALAGLLVLSVAALVLERERAKSAAPCALRPPKAEQRDQQLPSAA